jgi:hypothetical protein
LEKAIFPGSILEEWKMTNLYQIAKRWFKQNEDYVYFGLILSMSLAGARLIGLSNLESEDLRAKKRYAIDTSIPPQVRDVNSDGIEDIVLRRYNGEEIVLFGREAGKYSFGEREEEGK